MTMTNSREGWALTQRTWNMKLLIAATAALLTASGSAIGATHHGGAPISDICVTTPTVTVCKTTNCLTVDAAPVPADGPGGVMIPDQVCLPSTQLASPVGTVQS